MYLYYNNNKLALRTYYKDVRDLEDGYGYPFQTKVGKYE